MDNERGKWRNLNKTEINELKSRLAQVGLDMARLENKRDYPEDNDIKSKIDSLLDDILGKMSGTTTIIDTEPAVVLTGSGEKEKRRVVVTGLGTINPLGYSVEEFWAGLRKGQSGIAPMTLSKTDGYPTKIAGEVKEWDPKKYIDTKDARRMSRASQFAVAASFQAIKDAGLKIEHDVAEDYGVLLGVGNCAFPEVEQGARTLLEKGGMRLSPFFIPIILPNMSSSQVALQAGIKGYNGTIVTACASSTQSIGEAAEVIKRGDAEVMITGGCEAPISELGLASFSVMRAMSSKYNERPTQASRPFDRERDGFVPSEGAGIVVLENLEHAQARGARIYAEVIGFAATNDAYHLTDPDPDSFGAVRAMRRAIHRAGLAPRDIDYINAHGTSTEKNDKMETVAIKKVFGNYAYQIPISSTKSMIGHLLGGAGGVEAIATITMMQEELIHPTINLDNPDPDCDLDYVPNRARPFKINIGMSNSFGFGGQNACLIFKKYTPESPEAKR
ncbi:beta-ketoacyl-ACP synthase II [Candidatus Chlorohelix sp.]|uniref:beta-ketoacyl-ACP synthase II n=1 Tax=Candidatus Chlorohelix sp. TaxID=3139201 RepID=UPI003041F187